MTDQVVASLPEIQWESVLLILILDDAIDEKVFVDSIKNKNPKFDEKVVAEHLLRFFGPFSITEKPGNEKLGLSVVINKCFEHIRASLKNDSDRIAFLKKVIGVCIGSYVPLERQMIEISDICSDKSNRAHNDTDSVISELRELINSVNPDYIRHIVSYICDVETIASLMEIMNFIVLRDVSDSQYVSVFERYKTILLPEPDY